VWGELFRLESPYKPYSAPYIVLAVVDSCEWRPASESVGGANYPLPNANTGEGVARFLRLHPILPIKGDAPATPFWSDTAFIRYANGTIRAMGESMNLSVGDTVATAASASRLVTSCSTVKVEAGLLGGKPILEVIKTYQEHIDEE
jgi:hypothetical protein